MAPTAAQWRRGCVAASTLAGLVALSWTIVAVGPQMLLTQTAALGMLLPFAISMMGLRIGLQTWGWRLAMEPLGRPTPMETLCAVVAGEGVGYLAWGPLSREPTKAEFVSHRMSTGEALASAGIERASSAAATTVLAALAFGIVAWRHHASPIFWAALALTAAVGGCVACIRRSPRAPGGRAHEEGVVAEARRRWNALRRRHPARVLGLCVTGLAQEVINVIEAYVLLACLDVAPTVTSVIVLEGASRLLNTVGQFIPGKVGVVEAGSAGLTASLHLGVPSGLALALCRRFRSLVWSAVGLGLVAYRAKHSAGRPDRLHPAEA